MQHVRARLLAALLVSLAACAPEPQPLPAARIVAVAGDHSLLLSQHTAETWASTGIGIDGIPGDGWYRDFAPLPPGQRRSIPWARFIPPVDPIARPPRTVWLVVDGYAPTEVRVTSAE
jgi:hypothetical protein